MRQSNLQQILGKCCPAHLFNTKLPDEHICGICFQVMSHPVVLKCGQNTQHIFGLGCIKQWWKKKGVNDCPFCRAKVQQHTPKKQFQLPVADMKINCDNCKWDGKVCRFPLHELDCQKGLFNAIVAVKAATANSEGILTKIVEHIKQKHKKDCSFPTRNFEWVKFNWNEVVDTKICVECLILVTKNPEIFGVGKFDIIKNLRILEQADPIWFIRDLFED